MVHKQDKPLGEIAKLSEIPKLFSKPFPPLNSFPEWSSLTIDLLSPQALVLEKFLQDNPHSGPLNLQQESKKMMISIPLNSSTDIIPTSLPGFSSFANALSHACFWAVFNVYYAVFRFNLDQDKCSKDQIMLIGRRLSLRPEHSRWWGKSKLVNTPLKPGSTSFLLVRTENKCD